MVVRVPWRTPWGCTEPCTRWAFWRRSMGWAPRSFDGDALLVGGGKMLWDFYGSLLWQHYVYVWLLWYTKITIVYMIYMCSLMGGSPIPKLLWFMLRKQLWLICGMPFQKVGSSMCHIFYMCMFSFCAMFESGFVFPSIGGWSSIHFRGETNIIYIATSDLD